MSPYRRNVLVGITVVSALIILGWMIIQFGGNLGSMFIGYQLSRGVEGNAWTGMDDAGFVPIRSIEIGE